MGLDVMLDWEPVLRRMEGVLVMMWARGLGARPKRSDQAVNKESSGMGVKGGAVAIDVWKCACWVMLLIWD